MCSALDAPDDRRREVEGECILELAGHRLILRAIRAGDAEREQAFVRHLSPSSNYSRFMGIVRELSPDQLRSFVSVDGTHSAALVALDPEHEDDFVAVARYVACAEPMTCEFAVTVADAWQHRGIGRRMLRGVIGEARSHGYARMTGTILRSNEAMLGLASGLGFSVRPDPASLDVCIAELDLTIGNPHEEPGRT
jgi:acetyltransferase